MRHKISPFYLFAVLHESKLLRNTVYSYSGNTIFLLKNLCKYFKAVIIAGTKFYRYQVLRLTLYLQGVLDLTERGGGNLCLTPV